MKTNPILVVAGTNRPSSNSLRIARLLLGHYRELALPAELLDLTELPLAIAAPSAYDEKPPELRPFLDAVVTASALHVVLAEYNGGPPGIMKLFMDHWEYPRAFEGKSVAFVGVAAGEWGGLRAVEQMQAIFAYRNARQMARRVFIKQVDDKFDANGTLMDAALAQRLRAQAVEFNQFVRYPSCGSGGACRNVLPAAS